MDRTSMIALLVSGVILGADMMNMIAVPPMFLSQTYKIILSGLVIIASYYHLPTAIVLASLLYVILNQEVVVEAPKKEQKPKEEHGSHTVLNLPEGEVNNTGTPGVFSDPELESVEHPLPTQDNSAPQETSTQVEKPIIADVEDPTLINQENLDSLVGMGENDLAPAL